MICEQCHECRSTQKHHLFSQTKWARKLYGKMIDHPRNIMLLCEGCHLTKAIPKYTEKEFCNALEIAPRSKTERRIK